MKRVKDIISDLINGAANAPSIDRQPPVLKTGEASVTVADLIEKYPPLYSNAYKAKIWSQIRHLWLSGSMPCGDDLVHVSQYRCEDGDFAVKKLCDTEIHAVDHFFDNKASDDIVTRWYLNFADPNLFAFYGSDLFAQDEIQCLEHPLLGSVREYLKSHPEDHISLFTKTGATPTPILVEGVPYMVEIHTALNVDGIDYSIYGNAFHTTELTNPAVLDQAIHISRKFTRSNIIAMCAPYPAYGKYRIEDIAYMLTCAIAAFSGAREMTKTAEAEIHTGRWGAGAFGGNEELALIVQILAGDICGIPRLVFHAVSAEKLDSAMRICQAFFESSKTGTPISRLITHLYSLGYKWGTSDGN